MAIRSANLSGVKMPNFGALGNISYAPGPEYKPDTSSIPAGQFTFNTMNTQDGKPTGSFAPAPNILPKDPFAPGANSGSGNEFNPNGLANAPAAQQPNARPVLQAPDPQLLDKQKGYQAQGYQAKGIGVSPNATVSGRLTQLIDENGRYIQQARQRAMQQMNARGFLNSTMAAEAGTRAAIDAVLPIAQGDASAYDQRELALMQQSNAARQFNAGAQNEASRWQSQLDAETNRFNKDTLNRMAMEQWSTLDGNRQQEFIARLTSSLNRDQAREVAQIQADAGRLASADTMFGNLMGQHLQNVAMAAANERWSPEQQQGFINLSLSQLRNFIPYYNVITGRPANGLSF